MHYPTWATWGKHMLGQYRFWFQNNVVHSIQIIKTKSLIKWKSLFKFRLPPTFWEEMPSKPCTWKWHYLTSGTGYIEVYCIRYMIYSSLHRIHVLEVYGIWHQCQPSFWTFGSMLVFHLSTHDYLSILQGDASFRGFNGLKGYFAYFWC